MNQRSARNRWWTLWSLLTVGIVGWMAYTMFVAEDKTVFMPGPLSDGHHQLAGSCESCHTSALGGLEVVQQSCETCHGDQRVKPFDSHPPAKFTDPRNADLLAKVNALQCVSCHTEHKPEITAVNGVTQPGDFCAHCHFNIAEETPSHAGMGFASCKDSGCHNYHDNRALYTDYLIKHADNAEHKDPAIVVAREFLATIDELIEYPRDAYPIEKLDVSAIDAPLAEKVSEQIRTDWLETSHAEAGVNCSACHQPLDAAGERTAWQDKPGIDGCQSCHGPEIKRFLLGKHGMKLAAGLPPMTPAEARQPMHQAVGHETLSCGSCHQPHRFDVRQAAVESCLTCHNDTHSNNYKKTVHYALWQAEIEGRAAENSGVSCATCHMPRVDFDVDEYLSRKVVDHNQSANLAPNSKMIRSACQSCHGLEFSINALADRDLIDRNFRGPSSIHVPSVDMARAENERYLREREKRK